MALKDEILSLRKEGKTYDQIQAKLNCSKATISYYLSPGGKERLQKRNLKFKRENPIKTKLYSFKSRVQQHDPKEMPVGYKNRNPIERKRVGFGKIAGNRKTGQCYVPVPFSTKEVTAQIEANPICYLTGTPIDLSKSETYSFDHITPATLGGTAELSNLGLSTTEANQAKADLPVAEFLELCRKVLTHHGFKVEPPK